VTRPGDGRLLSYPVDHWVAAGSAIGGVGRLLYEGAYDPSGGVLPSGPHGRSLRYAPNVEGAFRRRCGGRQRVESRGRGSSPVG
jgi:hypothetical protein